MFLFSSVSDTTNTQIKKEADGKFHCAHCDASYTRSNKLKNHLETKHDLMAKEDYLHHKCLYQGCEERFHKRTQLLEHQKKEHEVTFKETVLRFESIAAFHEWKEKEELNNHVYFSKQQGDTKSDKTTIKYFYCQQDGHLYSHRKEGEELRKTNRKFRRGSVKQGDNFTLFYSTDDVIFYRKAFAELTWFYFYYFYLLNIR